MSVPATRAHVDRFWGKDHTSCLNFSAVLMASQIARLGLMALFTNYPIAIPIINDNYLR